MSLLNLTMAKRIVYVVGGLYSPTGMAVILSQKIQYLANYTDYDLYMILTEKPDEPWFCDMNPRVKWVNFNINFDDLDTMPFVKKLYFYILKQRKYKKLFERYLLEIHPDITISALRRDINFINTIKDGSKKVGEIHFSRAFYRQFNFSFLPNKLNQLLTGLWMGGLIKKLKKLDKFVVLTNSDFEHWPELDNKIVISNFISEFPVNYSLLENKTVVAVGRYTWQKGFDLLIDAWSIVSKTNSDWNLHIYGLGDKEYYQTLAQNKGIDNRVICNSAVKDVYEVYMKSSIFVLSSRYEGLPLVLIEAMATGLPSVSFACPDGPSDIITDGEDGILVENGNVEQLANSLISLIKNPEERLRMGHNARRNMNRYDKKTIMQQWINLFESL